MIDLCLEILKRCYNQNGMMKLLFRDRQRNIKIKPIFLLPFILEYNVFFFIFIFTFTNIQVNLIICNFFSIWIRGIKRVIFRTEIQLVINKSIDKFVCPNTKKFFF